MVDQTLEVWKTRPRGVRIYLNAWIDQKLYISKFYDMDELN